jgi:putative transposase
MDVLQIDHTQVDVIAVDEQKRLPIGRPWLTLAIDVRTRMVAGFHVSLWSPSTLSLSLVLSQAVLPKTSWLADRELQTLDRPVQGCRKQFMSKTPKSFTPKRWCPAAKCMASVLTTVRPSSRIEAVDFP